MFVTHQHMENPGSTKPPGVSASTGESLSPLWTVKQLAAFLGVKPGTVYKMVEREELLAVRLGQNGRTLRFRREHVEAWLAGRESSST